MKTFQSKTNIRTVIYSLAVLIVIGLSMVFAWQTTLRNLTDPKVIFNTFERTSSIWLYSEKIGSVAASRPERARFAIGGPLGLSSKEAIYFVARQDDQGETLNSNCDYRVYGRPIDSRWWSLTLYDSETNHYVKNDIKRSSWNSAGIPRLKDGQWIVNISSMPQVRVWLPSQAEPGKTFELVIRVYNPSEQTRAAVPNIDLPNIERVSC